MKTTQKIKNGIYSLIGGAVAQITGGEPPKNPWTPTEGLTEACFAAAADGIVLLENDGVLPLGKQNRISLFGRCQTDYFYVGYGSGGDVRAPYRVNLVEAMKKSGFLLNENLLGVYDSWRKDNPPFDGFWGHWPYNYEEMPVTAELAARAAAESDVAVAVIGRAAGEDRENKLKEGSFFLTETEKQMLESVTSAFEKTVVVLDCGNVIDFSRVKKYKIIRTFTRLARRNGKLQRSRRGTRRQRKSLGKDYRQHSGFVRFLPVLGQFRKPQIERICGRYFRRIPLF